MNNVQCVVCLAHKEEPIMLAVEAKHGTVYCCNTEGCYVAVLDKLKNEPSMRSFLVTVKTAAYPDYTVKVAAIREGKAKTMAMLTYPNKLAGAFVEYDVTEA